MNYSYKIVQDPNPLHPSLMPEMRGFQVIFNSHNLKPLNTPSSARFNVGESNKACFPIFADQLELNRNLRLSLIPLMPIFGWPVVGRIEVNLISMSELEGNPNFDFSLRLARFVEMLNQYALKDCWSYSIFRQDPQSEQEECIEQIHSCYGNQKSLDAILSRKVDDLQKQSLRDEANMIFEGIKNLGVKPVKKKIISKRGFAYFRFHLHADFHTVVEVDRLKIYIYFNNGGMAVAKSSTGHHTQDKSVSGYIADTITTFEVLKKYLVEIEQKKQG